MGRGTVGSTRRVVDEVEAAFALEHAQRSASGNKDSSSSSSFGGDKERATQEAFLKQLEAAAAANHENRAARYLTREIFFSYPPKEREVLRHCAKSGADHPDSSIGCYIMTPDDLKTFAAFFDPLIRDYHKASPTDKHVTDWDASAMGENGVLDVSKLGLPELSIRVRVGRNLKHFNLPGMMYRAERIKFEQTMLQAFDVLIADPAFGGQVYSLTPDFDGKPNPNLITPEKYKELVDSHIMFDDMEADPYLKSAGISADWPYGRGCYQSANGQVIIWFGEEDQLRIMVMPKSTRIDQIFTHLKLVLDRVESIPGIDFVHDPDFGYITSCPSNLGTGMRASVHIKLPNLTRDGTDAKVKAVCKPLGLSVRGLGGEHTPIGADGTVDISPSVRLFIKECDIIAKLYEGIKRLIEEENTLV